MRFNCAAIPGELAEAELFGHARGAFTGAVQAHRGFFGQADGGTLVFDEVAELPLPVQAKLLHALQDGALGTDGEIGLEAFAPASDAPAAGGGADATAEGTLSLREQVAAVERSLIGRTLAEVGGNQSEAARRLGLSRGSLIVRLRKYGPSFLSPAALAGTSPGSP